MNVVLPWRRMIMNLLLESMLCSVRIGVLRMISDRCDESFLTFYTKFVFDSVACYGETNAEVGGVGMHL